MKNPKPLAWPQFDRAADKAVLEVLHSGRVNYWTGEKGREFEAAFAKYLGVKGACSVSNGSMALELSLQALGIGPRDEVIVTTYSFRASATSVARVGAKMVFADVGNDHLLSLETIEKVITARTKAILVVHLFGEVVDLKPILALAKKHRLFVIEDCAQCLGGEYRGKKVGTWGDVGCFSFCQSKHITTGGEGGLVVAKRADVLRRVESLRDHGWIVGSKPKRFELIGTNARMTEIQSAIGLVELKRFTTWNLPRRRRLSAALMNGLKNHPLVRFAPVDTPIRRASFWLMPFVLDETKLSIPVATFIERLQKEGALCYKIMWPLMKKTPMASRLIGNTIGFWVHPTYTIRDITRTLAIFNRVYGRYGL